ncbi:MAG: DUF1592 domain-containing protein [Planctomycetota bacterium]
MLLPGGPLVAAGPSGEAEKVKAEAPNNLEQVRQWKQEGWPLLQTYCLDCHNEDYQEAELDLSVYADIESWIAKPEGGQSGKRVLDMIRFGAMPPEDAELPSDDERKKLGDLLDEAMYGLVCDDTVRPGKVTARRLNKNEYNHAIRDLFGMDLRPADAFPSDEVGAGFDNNGDILSVSPMLLEKYLTAAESIAQKVVIDPDTLPRLDVDLSPDKLWVIGDVRNGSFFGRFLAPDALTAVQFDVPYDGRYKLETFGGSSVKGDKEYRLAICDSQGRLVALMKHNFYGGGGRADHESFDLELKAGKSSFYCIPIEDDRELVVGETVIEEAQEVSAEALAQAQQNATEPLQKSPKFKPEEFPFMLRKVILRGPKKMPRHLFPPSQFELTRKMPRRRRDRWDDVAAAARESLRPLMQRAFRRPIDDAELEPYVKLAEDRTQQSGDYFTGLRSAITAILVSPSFLFRVEAPEDDAPVDKDGNYRLNDWQMASRLSFFLYSSIPDERLLDDAFKGKLDDQRVSDHVQRMLSDPKSDALATEFAEQWLGLRNVAEHRVDGEQFGAFPESLRESMVEESRRLFLHVLREDLPVTELLVSDYSFLNRELAQHYGVDGVRGDEFQRVSLANTARRGVLSHASVLTLTSNPDRTSPVQRGKWILENILGTTPPEPPPGVPELEDAKHDTSGMTLRQQLELHRADPACAACHRVMDQLGFGLESFDAVGRFRDSDGGSKVDDSGTLPGGRRFAGASELASLLAASESENFAKTVTQRLLTFAIGRELRPSDRCHVDKIVAEAAGEGYRLSDLVRGVVFSPPFQQYSP